MPETTSGDMNVFLSLSLFWDDRCRKRVEVTALGLNLGGCECAWFSARVSVHVFVRERI